MLYFLIFVVVALVAALSFIYIAFIHRAAHTQKLLGVLRPVDAVLNALLDRGADALQATSDHAIRSFTDWQKQRTLQKAQDHAIAQRKNWKRDALLALDYEFIPREKSAGLGILGACLQLHGIFSNDPWEYIAGTNLAHDSDAGERNVLAARKQPVEFVYTAAMACGGGLSRQIVMCYDFDIFVTTRVVSVQRVDAELFGYIQSGKANLKVQFDKEEGCWVLL